MRKVLITGVNGGIAQSLIDQLLALEYEIIGIDLTECETTGITFYKVDLTDMNAIKEFVQTTLKGTKLDSIIHLAGIYPNIKYKEYSDVLWDKVFSVNVKSIFYLFNQLMKVGIPVSLESVVLVSSMASKTGSSDPAYAASKAALNGLGDTLSKVLSKYKVRVNTVLPGIIETNMSSVQSIDRKSYHISRTLSKKIGQPEEVASMINFLISPKASYIWGGTFEVSGGMK